MKKILYLLLLISSFASAQVGSQYIPKIYYVNAYGAVHDGTTDDEPAIQRAINACETAGGGAVHLGSGNYAVHSTVLINKSNTILEGEGAATIITATADLSPGIITLIPVTNPATVADAFHDVGVRNLSIQATTTQTSGAAIYTTYTHSCTVQDVVIGFFRTATSPNNVITPFFDGVHFENESNMIMRNTQIYAWHCGVLVSGTQVGNPYRNTNNFDGLITGNCLILGDTTKWHAADTTAGLKLGGGIGGIQLEESNISFYTNNVKVTTNNGLTNAEIFLGHAFSSDNAGGDGIYIAPSSFHILQITGGWSCASGNAVALSNGIHIASPNSVGHTVITGGTSHTNPGYAIYCEAGTIVISGMEFKAGGANTTGDIYFGANVTSASVVGTDAVTVTNASAITPTLVGNSGQLTTQTIGSSNNHYLYSSSATGTSNFALLNDQTHYISDNMFGHSNAGYVVGASLSSADLAARIAYSTKGLIEGTYGLVNAAPFYLGSNMSTTVSYQMKLDSANIYLLSPTQMRINQNGVTDFKVSNKTAGASSYSLIELEEDGGSGYLAQTSSTTGVTGIVGPSMLYLSGGMTGGVGLVAATGPIRFSAGSATNVEGGRFSTGNHFLLGTGTDVNAFQGIAAGTTVLAQMNLVAGTKKTTLVDGDLTHTSGHLYFHDGSTDYDLLAAGGGMTNPMTTTADIIYSSSGSTPARLGIGSTWDDLSVVSGLPAWVPKMRRNNTVFTPSTGGTITVTNNAYNIINPAGTIATLTVNMPNSPVNGDIVMLKFVQTVTSITFVSGTGSAGYGNGYTPTSSQEIHLVYNSTDNKWY